MNTKQNIVVFDLDGTLADVDHRLHFIKSGKKDWDGFFGACHADAPIISTIEILKALRRSGYQIWVVTGRSAAVSELTKAWLRNHTGGWDALIMRDAGDHRHDDELKREWLESGRIPKDQILCVFEDRARVVRMWRQAGLICHQVAHGDF